MFSRFLVPLILVVLAACSTTEDPATQQPNGEGAYGEGGMGSYGNIVPGTQEDLVATVGDRVFFEYNSSTLDDASQQTLRRQAEWLNKYDNVNVTVEGHADERGTREYNLALGERRASAAKNYLISLGVGASRVSTISYGKEHPEFLGSEEVSWSKNRRAVTVVR